MYYLRVSKGIIFPQLHFPRKSMCFDISKFSSSLYACIFEKHITGMIEKIIFPK